MNLANRITIFRILLVPFFILLMIYNTFPMRLSALLVFIIASITDTIDGYMARKYGTVTDFGKFLDPLADKLLVSAALISFVQIKELSIPAWMVTVIISREFIITGIRTVATSKNIIIPAALSGKFKTTFQMIAIVIILAILCLDSFLQTYLEKDYSNIPQLKLIPYILMFITTILTLVSGFSYIFKHKYLFTDK
ncbi:MAG: CDP-diacylglycerol--glycerol-3-phosphate 3-phosphatidyltransferase [Elusimicrobia bacterium RIFOXYC2_FULL_34_12]|nr:MAG: CDP-diacylglycerol--glycerol-3-phosphate 3-phosphatidyltransferase [Elusimicrobia bacterium RIFOXYC2_FULL_34_12]OGS38639.1 MAG: CDP-diacylglycerol--glycerol-3-phosphate 3-phosphatidyltransferase [Elusimicrobia bacterium RIFOXYD2_FULL_34_30]HAM39472.1 CDP-diacylglycerol--glycerol-3-phosphate 3-phosphatidyltransferase [Elusimicrobiota bacterium]